MLGTDVQIIYKKYYIHIAYIKRVLLIFVCISVPTKNGGKMTKLDKIKFALIYCSEKRCDECPYNRWVRGVCQTHLCKDTLKMINELEHPPTIELEQISIEI